MKEIVFVFVLMRDENLNGVVGGAELGRPDDVSDCECYGR